MSSSIPAPLFRHGPPAFDHDCVHCRFLGTVDRMDSSLIPADVTEVDLYAHTSPQAGHFATDVIVRYGNEPIEQVKGEGQHAFTREPHLEAAAERTNMLGLLRPA